MKKKNSGAFFKNVTLAEDWIVMMMTRRRRRKMVMMVIRRRTMVMMMIMRRRMMIWVDFSALEDLQTGWFLVTVS